MKTRFTPPSGAHRGDVHLRAKRDVIAGRLAALAAIEQAPGCFAVLC